MNPNKIKDAWITGCVMKFDVMFSLIRDVCVLWEKNESQKLLIQLYCMPLYMYILLMEGSSFQCVSYFSLFDVLESTTSITSLEAR